MTLFLGLLAGSLLFGVVLWKLGQREPRPWAEGRSEIGHTILLLIFSLQAVGWAFQQWTDLGSAIGHLHTASPTDLPGYLADAELARRRLVMGVIWSTLVVSLFAFHLNRLLAPFIHRIFKTAAPSQETHA